MPVSEQVTGPVAIWVGVPITVQTAIASTLNQSGGLFANTTPQVTQQVVVAPVFFGWGETAPEPEFLPEYEPIMADLRGSRKAHDKLYEGVDARVTATMTIWDEDVLEGMQAYTKSVTPVGSDGGFDIGTLMHAEKKSFQLWLVYPLIAKGFMVAAHMRPGYHFFGAMLDGPCRRRQGTTVNKLLLSWYCGNPIVNGYYKCYDHDMSAVAGKPTNINRT